MKFKLSERLRDRQIFANHAAIRQAHNKLIRRHDLRCRVWDVGPNAFAVQGLILPHLLLVADSHECTGVAVRLPNGKWIRCIMETDLDLSEQVVEIISTALAAQPSEQVDGPWIT